MTPDETVELATLQMPEKLKEWFMESEGYNKGVYAIDQAIRDWFEKGFHGRGDSRL
jgi:hypothetical protein